MRINNPSHQTEVVGESFVSQAPRPLRIATEAMRPTPGHSFFTFTADLIAGSPNETHNAMTAATQMYHGSES